MLNIFIRVDASYQIGSGHVARCLTLAGNLSNFNDIKIRFICRDLKGNLIKEIKKKYDVLVLRSKKNNSLKGYRSWLTVTQKVDAEMTLDKIKKYDVHCVIVDSYSIDYKWEEKIKSKSRKIVVIDDLANRKHSCDILIDNNYYLNFLNRYNKLVSSKTKKFLGPKYVLYREEFKNKIINKKKSKKQNSVTIFIGGHKPDKNINFIIDLLNNITNTKYSISLILGPSTNSIKKIKDKYKINKNIKIFVNTKNIARIIALSDFCIVSGGTIVSETMLLSKPTIVIVVAKNQVQIAQDLNKRGFIIYILDEDLKQNDFLLEKLNELHKRYYLLKKRLINYAKNYSNQNNYKLINEILNETRNRS